MTTSTDLDRQDSASLLQWAITAVIVMVLVYPLALWLREAGVVGPTGPSLSAAQTALQQSYEAYQAGRYQAAIDAARAALAKDPNLAEAYNNIAVSSLQLRRYDEAMEAAQTALELKPDFDLARFNLMWIQREKAAAGNTTVVEKLMRQGLDLLYTQRNPGAAIERFHQVLALVPDHYGASYQLAAALQQAGQLVEARSQWIKALGMARANDDAETEALILSNLNSGDAKHDGNP